MSVKANHEILPTVNLSGQAKDPYGIPVSSNSPRRDKGQTHQTPRGRAVYDGVRVPVLKDMDRHSVKGPTATCRFDIVEKVTTVIKAGTYGPSEYNTSADEPGKVAGLNTDHGQRITLNVSRQPTFHTTVSRSSDQDVWTKISPYKWNQWVKTAKEGDARDVLYKNTYCMERDNLRYRTLTLPRIGDRPRTVGEKPTENYRPTTPDHVKNSTGVTIVPQQPRGTVVRFREYMRPYTYSSDGTALEIKRFNSKANQVNHFTTMRNVFPIIRQDSRQCSRKSERPLKFENSRYIRSNKETLFNKQVLPIYKSALERDYSSADTFKEYLESLQQCATTNAPYTYSRENTKRDREILLDYNNQALQRVRSVNEPEVADGPGSQVPATPKVQDNRSITIEIKSSWKEQEENDSNSAKTPSRKDDAPKPGTIDNLSSVHGSVVQPRDESKFVAGPTSSTVVNAGIAKNEGGGPKNSGAPPEGLPVPPSPRVSEGGATCPTNTPTPMDDV